LETDVLIPLVQSPLQQPVPLAEGDGLGSCGGECQAGTCSALEPGATTWRSRSACLEEDPELFFPIANTGPALLQIEEARVVCRRCEIIETCLKWAIESGQEAGVWGGLSEDERRALKRPNARARRVG
jgi:WhiB family redox-sensing transcriptional regulator